MCYGPNSKKRQELIVCVMGQTLRKDKRWLYICVMGQTLRKDKSWLYVFNNTNLIWDFQNIFSVFVWSNILVFVVQIFGQGQRWVKLFQNVTLDTVPCTYNVYTFSINKAENAGEHTLFSLDYWEKFSKYCDIFIGFWNNNIFLFTVHCYSMIVFLTFSFRTFRS